MKDEFGVKIFEELIDILWENRKQLEDPEFHFDYPDYGGLPKRISNKLRSDAVDIIQECYNPYDMKDIKRKATFRNWLKDSLFILST